jgi:hypothetical protein
MFPPRYHGTAFTVLYSNEPVLKNPIKVHLITSLDSFELISADWRTSIQKFQPGDIDRVDNKKTAVVLAMKPGSKLTTVTLTTKPEPSDDLAAALTVVLAIPRPEIRFLALSQILPTFRFTERSQSMKLHKSIMDATTNFLLFFSGSKGSSATNGPFVDVFTCLYRVRYRNSKVVAPEPSVPDTVQAIKRHLVLLWCSAITKCAQPAETPIAKLFSSRVALNAAQTVAKAGESLGINCDELLQTTGGYAEQGSPDGVELAVGKIEMIVQEAINTEIAAIEPPDIGHIRLMLNIVIMVFAGVIVGMYQPDIDDLAERTVAFTSAIVTGTGIDQTKRDLIQIQALFLKNMLGFLDGLRFEDPFQYIFCLWDLPQPELGPINFE